MANKDYVKQEIQELSVRIACLEYDYENAIIHGKPLAYRRLLAENITSERYIRKCLKDGNFSKLPYAVKLLSNSSK